MTCQALEILCALLTPSNLITVLWSRYFCHPIFTQCCCTVTAVLGESLSPECWGVGAPALPFHQTRRGQVQVGRELALWPSEGQVWDLSDSQACGLPAVALRGLGPGDTRLPIALFLQDKSFLTSTFSTPIRAKIWDIGTRGVGTAKLPEFSKLVLSAFLIQTGTSQRS